MNHSNKFYLIKRLYDLGRADELYLDRAVLAGAITEAEKAEIMGVSLPLET